MPPARGLHGCLGPRPQPAAPRVGRRRRRGGPRPRPCARARGLPGGRRAGGGFSAPAQTPPPFGFSQWNLRAASGDPAAAARALPAGWPGGRGLRVAGGRPASRHAPDHPPRPRLPAPAGPAPRPSFPLAPPQTIAHGFSACLGFRVLTQPLPGCFPRAGSTTQPSSSH